MPSGLILVVLGKQGSGKGTQCVKLSQRFAIPHISTGDMLRAEVKAKTALGLQAQLAMEKGELISDSLIIKMVEKRIELDDARTRGFILDGFPRTLSQAKSLDEMLSPQEIDMVINLEVPTSVVLKRIASRRVCVDCQAVYSLAKPPRFNWTCDLCGGEVLQREDDTEEAILRRLVLYEEETAPLIEYYQERNKLHRVSGLGSEEAVALRLDKLIRSYLKRREAKQTRD